MPSFKRPYLQTINWLLAGLTVIFLAAWLMPRPEILQDTNIMPLWLHTSAEIFSIVIAVQTFGVAWNAYSAERPGNILILACALLAVGLIDLGHALSFAGMPDFFTPSNPEKAIHFWLIARLLAAMALLAVACRPWKPLVQVRSRIWILWGCLAVVGLAYWLNLVRADLWPRTFIPGSGLTSFKVVSEYFIAGIMLTAAIRFYRQAKQGRASEQVINLYACAVITVLSEMSFVLYSEVTDFFNLLGHLYKIAAYTFIYKAVFIGSVREPFEKLQIAQTEIKKSRQMLQSIIDTVPVRIFWKDRQSNYLGANNLFLQDAGIHQGEQLVGRNDFQLFPSYAEHYRNDDSHVMAAAEPKLLFEESLDASTGDNRVVLTSKVPLYEPDTQEVIGILGTYTDITQIKLAEQIIQRQANYDMLTNLPNRRLFNDRLEQAIKKSHRSQNSLALMLIDLDRFKEVNDTLGHAIGDLLLVAAAERLASCVRDSDTVARLGGDEFAVILGEVADPDHIERVAQNILKELAQPFQLENELAYISASIGITIYPTDAADFETLLQNGDQAMYAAKQQGRNRFNYFTPAMQEAAQIRMRLATDLRTAIAENQFQVYYQPIVDLATGNIYKAEALVRWQHPSRGLINPAEFIPVAEDTGMIVDIGDWVFRTAALQVKKWRARYTDFQVSINKSPVQFQSLDNFHAEWFDYLDKLGVPGRSIVVEITEGLLMDASAEVTAKLSDLRKAGIAVALDDFGTGYSSLSYLKKFDIDYLKIDQSFTRNLALDSDDMALCEAIIMMAHRLGIKVIAEGIETEDQRRLLAEAGCNFGQGYFFSKPIPADDFDELLSSNLLTVTPP